MREWAGWTFVGLAGGTVLGLAAAQGHTLLALVIALLFGLLGCFLLAAERTEHKAPALEVVSEQGTQGVSIGYMTIANRREDLEGEMFLRVRNLRSGTLKRVQAHVDSVKSLPSGQTPMGFAMWNTPFSLPFQNGSVSMDIPPESHLTTPIHVRFIHCKGNITSLGDSGVNLIDGEYLVSITAVGFDDHGEVPPFHDVFRVTIKDRTGVIMQSAGAMAAGGGEGND